MRNINYNWVPPTYTELRTLVFKDHPFHCADCNAELTFKHPNYEYKAENKKRVMISSHYTDALCRTCFAKRLKLWFATPLKSLTKHGKYKLTKSDRKIGTCDTCYKTRKKVASIIWTDWCNSRFGSDWWNGFWICRDCLCECVLLGKDSHTMVDYSIKGEKTTYNEVGARILI
jgi:hypothetical protein